MTQIAKSTRKKTPTGSKLDIKLPAIESKLPENFWQEHLKFRSAPAQAFLASVLRIEEALKDAVSMCEFQLINDVEMGFALRADAFMADNINAPAPRIERFQKHLSKAFSMHLGRESLPFCKSVATFKTKALEFGQVRPEKNIPTAVCLVPFLAPAKLWDLLQDLLIQWHTLPLKVRPAEPKGGLLFKEITVLRILGWLHCSYALDLKGIAYLTPLQKLQAFQNRAQGGLVGFLQRLVPSPPQAPALEFELLPETQTAVFPFLKNTKTSPPRLFNFADSTEIWNAVTVAAVFAAKGGALAGPDFLLSGDAKWEELPPNLIPTEDATEAYDIAGFDPNHAQLWDIVTQNLLFVSPVLKYETRFNMQNLLASQSAILTAQIKTIERELIPSVRWRTRSGEAAESLTTGLQFYLEQMLSETKEQGPEEKKVLDVVTLVPEYFFLIDGKELTEDEFLAAKEHGSNHLMKMNDGSQIPKAEYDRVLALYLTRKRTFARMGEIGFNNLFKANMLAANVDERHTKGSLDKFAALLSMHLDERMKSDEKKGVDEMARILSERRPLSPHADLWDFQSRGVAWVLSRFHLRLNACLADEMGLGKTITSICILSLMKPSCAAPALVLAPKSLITNWQLELQKFAPHLTVAELNGEIFPTEAQVVVCGYHKFRAWKQRNKNVTEPKISLLVLDEAHVLKNSDTKLSETVRELSASFKLALTGTPLENHLGELWNLLDILNPGFLGGVTSFRAYAEHARKKAETRELMLKPLREFLWAVMLRRTKKCAEVKLELPEKIFSSELLNLTSEQAMAYRSVLELALNKGLLAKSSFGQRAIFLKAILHLKQICIHPDVFFTGKEDDFVFGEKEADEYVRAKDEIREQCLQLAKAEKNLKTTKQKFDHILKRSEKFTRVFEILEEMKESERGILVFTQFLGAARLLQLALNLSGEPQWANTEIFDGQLTTKQRNTLVENFQQKCKAPKSAEQTACPLLILSLKAGGVGLNLTGATAVIHLDRWWNPAVEDQATDRAHRMGQTDAVTVVTLTAVGTIEESLENILEVKRALAKDILGQGSQTSLGDLMSSPEGFAQLVDPARKFGAERMMK